MEWVETTGRTIEEAKDRALDELGVAEDDAEFEILEEPKTGLFGRLRSEARVRARVRPMQPRPKLDRRDRRGRGPKGGKGRGNGRGKRSTEAAPASSEPQGAAVAVAEAAPAAEAPAQDSPAPATPPETAPAASDAPATTTNGGSGRRSRRSRGRSSAPTTTDEESTEMSETELTAQGEVVRGFLVDLLDAFGLEGEVTTGTGEDGAIELAVTGADLGLLIGPKGQTLQAIQELARAVLQRQRPGETHARVRVDVGGYRQRRREALERFVRQIAEDVKATGVQKALEPMSPPDRKVVHDTVNTIDGVHTISEGEDDRRRVVIIPD